MSIASEIERYLRTGDTDTLGTAWPGRDIIECSRAAHKDLRAALVAEVQRRASSRPQSYATRELDVTSLTRRKTEPMIRGLFPRAEQDAVLALVERSVVFLTASNIGDVLSETSWHRTAWNLANLYLGGIGAELLAEDAPLLVGLSQDTTCFVTPAYFEEEDPFDDFVVHEVAHIFHNCKRRSVGLAETRRREWLLGIDFRQRENFAYACEAYSRVIERAATVRERIAVAAELGDSFGTGDDRVEPGEIASLVRDAAAKRNGWKVILAHCAPPPRERRT
ncbi:MAG: hypothetical protein EP329_25745 [Deltaproteobacteria bacterium]|nr:MAG: hypothetical protein EP329_25745 [Deltaproteobacteria bacterium]